MSNKMVGKAIMDYLEELGVKYIYGIPSGNLSKLYNDLIDTNIKPIVTKHESAAVFSAAAYTRENNCEEIGVAFVCGGVGVANAINGIADAYKNQLPVLIISGGPSTKVKGRGAIQELDTISLTKSITKFSREITEPKDTIQILNTAIEIAKQKPYGPVHISIPMDIPAMECEYFSPLLSNIKVDNRWVNSIVDSIIKDIDKSKSGLILVGRGANGIKNELDKLSNKLGWYIATTPQGKSNVNHSNPYYIGNFGFYSSDFAANYIKNKELDTILVLGSSLGESSTQNFDKDFFKNKRIIIINYDINTVCRYGENKPQTIICYDLKPIVKELVRKVSDKPNKEQKIIDKKLLFKSSENIVDGISIREFIEKIPSIMPKDTRYICDIGEFMNYVFKYLILPNESEFIASLNYGSMGSALCSSIGVSLSDISKTSAVIVGDGSFYMNGMELLTAKEYKLPIVYFIINNARYNYVEQGSQFIFGRSLKDISFQRIDISKVANTLGIKSFKINNLNQLDGLKEEFKDLKEPIVVELITNGEETAGQADRFKALK